MLRARTGFPSMKQLSILILAVSPLFGASSSEQASPHARLQSFGVQEARWTGGFWHQRFSLAERVMAPFLWEYFQGHSHELGISGIGRSQAWENLLIAGGKRKGTFEGRAWSDGDFYKWIESLAHIYAITRDERLDRLMDDVIGVIGMAQQPDGYINTQITVPQKPRFRNIVDHETYNLGHLMLAACAHHRATGKRSLMEIAKKVADCLHAEFADPARHFIGYTSIMGLTELYRVTRDQKYVQLAAEFVNKQGRVKGGVSKFQDWTPLRKESTATGHAVWGTYLYSGATDVFLETGDETLLPALTRIWDDLSTRKTFITGAVSAAHHTLTPDRSYAAEAFGNQYRFPNAFSSNETCSHIGSALWNWRLLKMTGEARYADAIERVIYNSMLSSVGLEGKTFFYTNPLRRHGANGVFLEDDTMTRWTHRIGYCCPPNILRMLASLHQWAYASAKDEVWINLYGSSVLSTRLADGNPMRLEQQTDYPWDGKVRVTVQLEKPATFALKVRIPSWAEGATVRVNGNAVKASVRPNEYTSVVRKWAGGDVVEIDLPLKVRLLEAHPLAEEVFGHVAVSRGPMVYCVESPDLPGGVGVSEIAIRSDIELAPRFDPHLLGGIVALEGLAMAVSEEEWPGPGLYRTLRRATTREVSIRLIPYYAWANRGISDMSVWMPVLPANPVLEATQ